MEFRSRIISLNIISERIDSFEPENWLRSFLKTRLPRATERGVSAKRQLFYVVVLGTGENDIQAFPCAHFAWPSLV
jgi:hypothetical protein